MKILKFDRILCKECNLCDLPIPEFLASLREQDITLTTMEHYHNMERIDNLINSCYRRVITLEAI